jgi:predicted TIM-barrel fold metal-dependent hydrolase
MTDKDESSLLQVVQPARSPSWAAASKEPALEPDLPIIDAHHHFSEHWGGYMPSDLLADAAGHRLVASVYVQCGWHYRNDGPDALRPLGETEQVVSVTNAVNSQPGSARVAAGIVGYVDLCQGAGIDEVLALQIQTGGGRFRGVRYSAARDPEFKHGVLPRPPEHLYSQADFREGYACLARHGLSFDAWVYHPQLEDVLELATSFPQTPLILDHLGGLLGVGRHAGRRDFAIAEWLPWMKRLAECPNVSLKIGGLGTAIFGFDFSRQTAPPSSRELADMWRPVIEPALDIFGASRCMFESNFPVDRSGAGYGVVWNAFKRIVEGADQAEKRMLFHDNAKRIYRL